MPYQGTYLQGTGFSKSVCFARDSQILMTWVIKLSHELIKASLFQLYEE